MFIALAAQGSEEALRAADKLWVEASPQQALPVYEDVLKHLPAEHEPFRSLIIMRLAYAHFHAGNKVQALNALRQLEQLEYVPEHHALAAGELSAVISGKPNPAHEKTAIPRYDEPVITIHVDATAGKEGDGSKSRPAGALHDAVRLAREAKARTGDGVAEIVLGPGTYLQEETLRLTGLDAGMVIRSLDAENPAVLTAGVALKTWARPTGAHARAQLPEASRERVLVCDLKAHGIRQVDKLIFGGFSSGRAAGRAANFETFPVPEFFYKGEPQTMARWPDDSLAKLPVDESPAQADPRFTRWSKEKDLWLYGYWHWDWADAYEKVASIDEAGKITLEQPTNRYGFRRKMGCAINALCELDQVGEWYLDTEEALLYFLPPDDFDPAACTLSTYGAIIEADGCPNLHLRDLRIEYVRGDALVFRNCPDLVVAHTAIRNCSGMGMQVLGGKGHLVHSCTIDSMGRGGISIQSGNWQELDPGHSVIENCRISNLSRIDRTYTPALLIEGMGYKVRHNAFVNIPSSAIRIEACDALIELNVFHRCVYESGDQGAIDMWANPLYRGNVIRWNDFDRIVNESGGHYGAAAVRHDDFISGFMVSENIFRKGSSHGFGSVQFNQGTDTYVEGNLIIDWHKAFSGRSVVGKAWKERITGHVNAKRVLAETDWQSEAWRKKYPMVRDLLNGDDNHNFLVDNQRFGHGSWGEVSAAISFMNTERDPAFHAETLGSVKPYLLPWHPIPLHRIGPYDPADAKAGFAPFDRPSSLP